MKNESLLRTPKPLLSASVPGILTALVLAVALVSAGFWVGKSNNAAPAAAKPDKPRFALLVKADDVPPADNGQQFREYSAWVHNLKRERFADGEALHGKAWALHQPADSPVQVTPFELKGQTEEISGYFLFEAADAEEALKIAKTCPHLQYRGTLELREIYQ